MPESARSIPPLIIKKYANRRLYNTATSKYITLEDVQRMVKEDVAFEVHDAKTGEDLTRMVLMQIILEQEGSRGASLLPLNFLRQLILFYDDNLNTVLPHYLENTMKQFTANQEFFHQAMERGVKEMTFPFKAFEELSRQQMDMFTRSIRMFSGFGKDSGEKK